MPRAAARRARASHVGSLPHAVERVSQAVQQPDSRRRRAEAARTVSVVEPGSVLTRRQEGGFVQPLDPRKDPARIGPFTLLGRLGAGGMGQVYLGSSPGGRKVAVKVVHTHLLDGDPTFRSRFRHEVEAAKRVGGFYTAAIVDSDAIGDPPWYASAYIDAPTLHEVIDRDGPLDVGRASALGAGLAEALQAIPPSTWSTVTSSRPTSSWPPTGRGSSTSASCASPTSAPRSPAAGCASGRSATSRPNSSTGSP
jgi:hypothetical protein